MEGSDSDGSDGDGDGDGRGEGELGAYKWHTGMSDHNRMFMTSLTMCSTLSLMHGSTRRANDGVRGGMGT